MIAPTIPHTDPREIHFLEYLAELLCLSCGNRPGYLVSAFPIKHVPIRTCGRCGGQVMVSDLETRRRHVTTPALFGPGEKPRTGRPPKWLAEQRRRERELNGEQSEDVVS